MSSFQKHLYESAAGTMDSPSLKLYIVATPIGTLGDLSPRAQEVLSHVPLVFCEDTRTTFHLLKAKGLPIPKLVTLHQEKQKLHQYFQMLRESQSAALVVDAGTPGVSDPGSVFVQMAHEQNVQILNVPGPSSLACALASCGFLEQRVCFSGFLPRPLNEKVEEFARWKRIAPCVAVFFESPLRLKASLHSLQTTFGETLEVCVSREISKKFEENTRGSIKDVLAKYESQEILGECVEGGYKDGVT